MKLARVIGKSYPRKEFSFRGCLFYSKTLGGVDSFSNQFVYFATGWTFEGNPGVCSDLLYAISKKFHLDENNEMGLWMADKFKSDAQLLNIEKLKSEIKIAGGNPDSRGVE